jgi:drug/metabolite transporter (DMT)-like permease
MQRISRLGTAVPRSAVAAGIGMMLLGMLLFSLNDVMGKWLLATYTVGQLLLIRSVAAAVLLAPFVRREGVAAFTSLPRPGLQAVRAFFSTAEVVFFYWAVIYLPLADVITFYLAGPVYVTALSVLLLGERVGWRRWSAVLIGFAGVIIALRPSAATFTWPALIALSGSVFFAISMICTRILRGTSDTMLVATQTLGALAFGLVAAPFAWVAPSLRDFLLLCLLGVVALVAHACTNRSLKLAPASVVVPYQYTLIVWAVLFGWLVFGDVPAAQMLLGAAIIIAAGLFIFLREQAVGEETPPPEAHP